MRRKKLIVVIAVSVAVIAALCAVIFGEQGFWDMYSIYKEDTVREREITAAQAEIDSLKREIELLKSDTLYIEKIAREKLGMARKDEIIYKFVEEKE